MEISNRLTAGTCLIVDDHPLVCSAIEHLLNVSKRFEHVFSDTDASQSLNFIRQHPVDLLILDVGLDETDGFEFLRRARAHGFSGKALYVSGSDAQIYSETAQKLGADGYIVKSEGLNIIDSAIEKIMAGQKVFSSIKNTHLRTIKEVKLSLRESMVFKYLLEGCSNKEISERLSLSSKTVSTYKTRILNKYKVKSIVELVNLKSILNKDLQDQAMQDQTMQSQTIQNKTIQA